MRKLTRIEQNALEFVAHRGGSYCPDEAEASEPMIMDTLKALVRKQRLRVEANDGAPPRYHLTGQGAVDASA